jgi:broad specificity phosphatase PhoE
MGPEILLIRHGQTKWNVSGQHTSTTDLSLTDKGKEQAKKLKPFLQQIPIEKIICSPMSRCIETCKLAGFDSFEEDPLIQEWNYGAAEGKTTPEIQKKISGWTIFTHGAPEGESVEEIEQRAKTWIANRSSSEGLIAIFSHGHFLRVLAASWIGLSPKYGQCLMLTNGTISMLSFSHEKRAIKYWNASPETLLREE